MVGKQALENLAITTDAVFDKTGTLTSGHLSVEKIINISSLPEQTVIQIAQTLESQSEHPIARAILSLQLSDGIMPIEAGQRINRVGFGISASLKINNQENLWAIGKPEFVAEIAGNMPSEIIEQHHNSTLIALGNHQGFVAAFLLKDQTKADIPAMLNALQQQQIRLHILSGDRQAAVQSLAQQLNINHVCAQATPEDKLAYVNQLQKQGNKVLMVGDGINDAPVLASADISISVAGGADVARAGSDIILLNDEMNIITQTINQAQKTRRIIRQNLWWASVYNLIAVPLAAAGFVTPWLAALGMSGSSLLVLANALRLRK